MPHHSDRILAALKRPPTAPGEGALADALARAVSTSELDLGALVAEWVGHRDDLFDCPTVAAAVRCLHDHGSPAPDGAFGPGLGAAVVTLPLASALAGSPRNLVSGVFHLARLLDPHPIGAFAAVAAAVACAAFVDGRRDVVPDVLEVLLINEAPQAMVEEVRKVPAWPQAPPPLDRGSVVGALAGVLWGLHHRGINVAAEEAWRDLGPSAQSLGRGLLAARNPNR